MLIDFFHYLYTINNNDISDYFNCYTTFLLTQKDLKDNVLNHRMKFLINYYVENKLNYKNKAHYYYYYLNNHNDDYLTVPFLPKESKMIVDEDEIYDSNDDVKDHYKFMTTPNPPKPVIDYEELDKKFYLEEEEKNNNISDDECDNDYYDDGYYTNEYDDYEEIDEDDEYNY